MNPLSTIIIILSIFYLTKFDSAFGDEKAIDESLARTFRLGDESRLYPTTEEALNKEFCSDYKERNDAFIDFIDEKYPRDHDLQILARLLKSDSEQKLTKVCKRNQSRASIFRYQSDLNSHVMELKVIRDDHMNVMAEAAKPNSTVDMAEYLCFWDKYVDRSLDVIKSPETRAQLEKNLKGISSYFENTLKNYFKKVKAANICDYSTIPKQQQQLQSVQLSGIYAIANIIKNSNINN